ncbi:MAG: ribose-5-phosphate isomerase RpiA [Devosiaceae bacterium]|nr:ribose-5-phosphate isomerase RpiA [Devosiaceae bacterium]
MTDLAKLLAAKAAIKEIGQARRIGLGTGSTARHFVQLLGEAVAQGFECISVATSLETEKQAKSLNIVLKDLDEVEELDLVVDGTDELDADLNLIKGGGGALLREKIVASKAKRMIVIADKSKMVTTLGEFPLPIEINRFAFVTTTNQIKNSMRELNYNGELKLRQTKNNEPFITDGGHYIIDAFFSRILDANRLSSTLLNIAGVVQHGLFLNMCDLALIADDNGVTRYEK